MTADTLIELLIDRMNAYAQASDDGYVVANWASELEDILAALHQSPVWKQGVPCNPFPDYPQACNLPGVSTHTTTDGVERCDMCGCPVPPNESPVGNDRLRALEAAIRHLCDTRERKDQRKPKGSGSVPIHEILAILDAEGVPGAAVPQQEPDDHAKALIIMRCTARTDVHGRCALPAGHQGRHRNSLEDAFGTATPVPVPQTGETQ